MTHFPPYPIQNLLLQSLVPSDFRLLSPYLERIELRIMDRLEDPQQPIAYAYFPESGIASVVAQMGDKRAEVGLIGREGMSGTPLLSADDRTPHECFVQVSGTAVRIRATDLLQAIAASKALGQKLRRYARSLTIQATYTALSNAHSNLDERLARWLLMIHDRVQGDTFRITHEFISQMMGVRRPGVTVALHLLEGRRLIYSRRGEVTIRDRDGLRSCANRSYGLSEREYTRLTGIPLGPSIISTDPSMSVS